MSNNAAHVLNESGTTLPASDEHANRAAGEQKQKVDQQTRPHVNQGTYLQYRPEPSGNRPAASHLDGTQSQTDGIIVHDDTSTSRNATHNHDNATSGDHVDDTTPPTMTQTLQERASTLASATNS